MANVQYTENLTEEQLDAMAGGETLRYQATSFGVTRNNKVRKVYLRRFLESSRLMKLQFSQIEILLWVYETQLC